MSLGQFRLGYRTLKTALAVMLCILLFQVLGRGTPMIACLAAVFALRQDVPTTITFGLYRILGNAIGGMAAILYFYIFRYFGYAFSVELLLIPFLVAAIIVISDRLNLNAGIMSTCATFFMIVLIVPETDTLLYGVERVVDTLIGTLLALAVNYLIKPVKPSAQPSLSHLEHQLHLKENELAQLTHKIEALNQAEKNANEKNGD